MSSNDLHLPKEGKKEKRSAVFPFAPFKYLALRLFSRRPVFVHFNSYIFAYFTGACFGLNDKKEVIAVKHFSDRKISLPCCPIKITNKIIK